VVGMRVRCTQPYERAHNAWAEAFGTGGNPERTSVLPSPIVDAAIVAMAVEKNHQVSAISGAKRGLTPNSKNWLRRRRRHRTRISEHMKSDGRLARCPLKGLRRRCHLRPVAVRLRPQYRKILNLPQSLFLSYMCSIPEMITLTLAVGPFCAQVGFKG